MKHKHDIYKSFACCAFLLLFYTTTSAKTFQVGPTRTYTLPSQVSSLVRDADTVAIDAGSYTDCTAWTRNNLVIEGVGGYAHLQNKSCGGKAIWIIQGNNTTVEQIEFSGATVVDKNGAGIRQEGANLTIRRCYFHDNEDGILAGDNANSNILIEYSEFANNGYGDGYSHNMYINHIASFTIQYCYIHHAKVGHDIKSRAYRTYILYNRISDENTGTASRNIDLPNGGFAVIIGNLIHHGLKTENSNSCEFGLEGLTNPIKNLYITNNTFVNERSPGSFINIPTSGTDTLKMVNNIFVGNATLLVGKAATLDTAANLIVSTPALAGLSNPVTYDYHLTRNSPALDTGVDPGYANGFSLFPTYEYLHVANRNLRKIVGQIDIGAYEFDSGVSVEKDENHIPLSIQLEQNYPNPFSQSTTIRYRITPPAANIRIQSEIRNTKSIITLKVFDVFGREILDLSDQARNTLQLTICSSQLPTLGVYFYRLITGEGVKTRTMIYR